jgi:hypothetical protein
MRPLHGHALPIVVMALADLASAFLIDDRWLDIGLLLQRPWDYWERFGFAGLCEDSAAASCHAHRVRCVGAET